jgi:putative transposase
MASDTASPRQFPRHLHAFQAVDLAQSWLRTLFAGPSEAAPALRSLILELATRRASFHTACRRAVELPALSVLGKWWRAWRGSHSLAEWEALLDAALRAPWTRVLRGERVQVICDWHSVPYWGRVPPELEATVRRGLAQSGTTRFFVYATAAILWRGSRLQVAVTPVGPAETQAAVFTRLMERVQALGCVVLAWIMDKGFYTAGVVAKLREQQQPYLIAAPRRGEQQGIAALLAQAEAQHGFQETEPPPQTHAYSLSSLDPAVAPQPTTVLLGWEPVAAKPRQRRQRTLRRSQTKPGQRWRALAWISGGRAWTVPKAQRAYTPRTGFESGYRLSKSCRGRTSSRDPSWRLFLFALSLLLQNAWVWLVIAGKRTPQRRWKRLRRSLPFVDFCHWIARYLEEELGDRFFVDLPAG